MYGKMRHKLCLEMTRFALRHLGPKRPATGEVEDAVRRDWSWSTQRIGLRRHAPWHDLFRGKWVHMHR